MVSETLVRSAPLFFSHHLYGPPRLVVSPEVSFRECQRLMEVELRKGLPASCPPPPASVSFPSIPRFGLCMCVCRQANRKM